MKTVFLIAIIVGISLGIVFVTGEIIWYFANQEFETSRDEFKDSLVGTFEESESIQLDDSFDDSFEESFEEPIDVLAPTPKCSGDTRCITGKVTQVIDGDTIKVDSQSIRFALSSAPELDEFNGVEAREFINELCPVGSAVIVDEDDEQIEGSYGRIIGVIYCNGLNLNSELLDSGLGYLSSEFCNTSEFATQAWTLKHGC